MKPEIYSKMAALEREHWWFVGRRTVVGKVLDNLPLSKDAEIFEAGCGTGGNLVMLARYGKVFAMEMDKVVMGYSRSHGSAQIQPGYLPESIPFSD